MPGGLFGSILTWIVFSFSIFLVAKLLPTVQLKGFGSALVVALVYGLLKFLLYYLLVFLSLPIIILTLGLFLFVVNAIFLWMTDKLVSGFKIKGFLNTIIASVLITIVDLVLRFFVGLIF